MTTTEAIKILEAHNAWRRGDNSEMQLPRLVGLAIDLAIKELKKKHKVDNNRKKV
jgi:hypothetical protein